MQNPLVASILRELADFTAIEDEQPYRSLAYKRAAQAIESLSEPIETLASEGRLREIPGIGENIERKIVEILKTGKLQTLEKLKRENPVDVSSLLRVEGIGPKTIKSLHKSLHIRNLTELEEATKEGRLEGFKGLGSRGTQQLLERIQNAKLKTSRVLLFEAKIIVDRLILQIREIPSIKRYAIAGSYRRMKETIGDLDVLIESDSPESINTFVNNQVVKEVIAAGETKASVKLEKNFQVDVRVVPKESWGAALIYFTGSKAHNIELRTRAIKMGYHLSEYGLFQSDGTTRVAGSDEAEVYTKLGLDYIEPELRESRGEIQAAERHELPNLVKIDEIKGDLQMHTRWSDGEASVENMAEAGRLKGYEYVAITDHVGSLKIANALDETRLREQKKEIDLLNKKYKNEGADFHVLQGAEVNISSNGTLDMPDKILESLDIVLASIHTGFTDSVEKITNRFRRALENENVDIIAHPTGRKILERTGYKIDLKSLIHGALETGTVLEIDGTPNRLDLSDENALEAIRSGCILAVDTDAHGPSELEYISTGLSQARRAWAEPKNVLNTKSYKDLLKFLES
jgi:DNA polymerase (family 10)